MATAGDRIKVKAKQGHHVDLPAARGFQQLLPPLPLGSTRAGFFDLQCNRPTLAGGGSSTLVGTGHETGAQCWPNFSESDHTLAGLLQRLQLPQNGGNQL